MLTKRCPLCGYTASVVRDYLANGYRVRCDDVCGCNYKGPVADNRFAAIAAHNEPVSSKVRKNLDESNPKRFSVPVSKGN